MSMKSLTSDAAAAPERLFESFLLGSGASARRAAAAAAPPAIPVRPQVKLHSRQIAGFMNSDHRRVSLMPKCSEWQRPVSLLSDPVFCIP